MRALRIAAARLVIGGALLALAAALEPLRQGLVALDPHLSSLLFCSAFVGAGLVSLARVASRQGWKARLQRNARTTRRFLERWGWALSILAFQLPLWSHWALQPPSLISATTAIAGHVPWLDAHGHFEGGTRLLAEGTFGSFSGRRPLSAAWLAVRLGLTRGSLPAALILQAVALGLAVWLFARAVAVRFGLAPALAAFALVLGLTREYVSTAVTEPFGVTLGCLAVAVFISPHSRVHLGAMAVALLALDAALQARPGAQFLLPLLVLWAIWVFRRSWRRAVPALALVAAAGGATTATLNAVYGAEGSSFASYPAFTLYGLVRGSNYKQAWADFPKEMEAWPAREDEVARFLYGKAFEAIRRRPLDLLRGLLRNEGRFLRKLPANLTRVIGPEALFRSPSRLELPDPGLPLWNLLWGGPLLIATLGAFLVRLRSDTATERLFWLAVLLGVASSAAFVYGDAGFRGLAAAYPFLALLLAAGLSGRWPRRLHATSHGSEGSVHRIVGFATGGLLVLCLAGPAVLHATWPRPRAEDLAGLSPERNLVFFVPHAAAIVVTNTPPSDIGFPIVARRAFLRHLYLAGIDQAIFTTRKPPFALLSVYDFVAQRQRLLIGPIELLRPPLGFVHLQVRPMDEGPVFLEVESWERLGSSISNRSAQRLNEAGGQ